MGTAARTAFLMAVLTLVSKCFGFVREMVMANYFGTTYITDAYVMAFTILSVLFGGLISAISTVYIPIYSRIREQQGEAEGNQFTNSIINLLLIISVLISLTGILFSEQIVTVFAGGFTDKTAELVSFYIKIFFAYVIFSSTAGILDSFLQYKGTFLPQVVSGYLISICTIAGIVISAYTSYYYLAFGMLMGYILRAVCIFTIARKKGYRHSSYFKQDHDLKAIFLLTLPTFFGSYMSNISVFVDKTMASGLKEGSVSALNYANLINSMIISVAITILATIVYPKLAKANSTEQFESFGQIVNTGLTVIFIIALPCSLGSMLYSNEIIHAVYERGAFDAAAAGITGSVFFYYSIGLIFMSINTLLFRVYYSMHNTITPMIYAVIGVIINIGMNFALIGPMGLSGLAFATSIASFCNSAMLFVGLHVKYPHVKVLQKGSVKKLAGIIVSAVGAVAISYLFFLMIISVTAIMIVRLFFAVAVGGLIYLGLLTLLRVEEAKLIKLIIKKSENR